jgi:hypothetical protein
MTVYSPVDLPFRSILLLEKKIPTGDFRIKMENPSIMSTIDHPFRFFSSLCGYGADAARDTNFGSDYFLLEFFYEANRPRLLSNLVAQDIYISDSTDCFK